MLIEEKEKLLSEINKFLKILSLHICDVEEVITYREKILHPKTPRGDMPHRGMAYDQEFRGKNYNNVYELFEKIDLYYSRQIKFVIKKEIFWEEEILKECERKLIFLHSYEISKYHKNVVNVFFEYPCSNGDPCSIQIYFSKFNVGNG